MGERDPQSHQARRWSGGSDNVDFAVARPRHVGAGIPLGDRILVRQDDQSSVVKLFAPENGLVTTSTAPRAKVVDDSATSGPNVEVHVMNGLATARLADDIVLVTTLAPLKSSVSDFPPVIEIGSRR